MIVHALLRAVVGALFGACGLWLLGGAVQASAADDTAIAEGHTLVLGRISDDPKRHYAQLTAMLDYVVPRMADLGVRRGRVLMAADVQQMASYLRRGRVDWVTETATTGMLLAERSGAKPLVITERNASPLYRSVIFVRRDSGIETLQELRGHTIAFQNRNSTSAYYAPAAALLDAGMQLEILLSPRDLPAPDVVGFVFAESESNIAAWVHKRLVIAGAFSDLDWQNSRTLPALYQRDLKVIYTSDEYPRGVEITRADMPKAWVNRLRELLVTAADDPQADEHLKRFFGTNRFLPIGDQFRRSLDETARTAARVRSKIE